MSMPLLRCTRCAREHPADTTYFAPNVRKKNGLDSWCRECNRIVSRERQRQRRADPNEHAKLLEEKRRYARSERGRTTKRLRSTIDNHRRRQRLLAVDYLWTYDDWRAVKAWWDNCCAYCGTRGRLTIDHYIPLAAPNCPGTVPWNIVPACQSCNSRKHSRDPRFWIGDVEHVEDIESVLYGVWELHAYADEYALHEP